MFTRRAKPIRTIGDPDNQRPDEWISTVVCPPHILQSCNKRSRDWAVAGICYGGSSL